MNDSQILGALIPVISAIATGMLTWFLTRKKTAADTSKVDAERDNIVADTAKVTVGTSKEIILSLNDRIKVLEDSERNHELRERAILRAMRCWSKQLEAAGIAPKPTMDELEQELDTVVKH